MAVEREPLLCPKCQSPKMLRQEIREAYKPFRKGQPPQLTSSVEERIVCSECGSQVWPERQFTKAPEKKGGKG